MTRTTAILTLFVATAFGSAGLSGCATTDEAETGAAAGGGASETASSRIAREEQERWRREHPREKQPAMHLDSELGVLDTDEVEDALQARFEDVRACYQRAGKAQEYAGGRVLLRFLVAGDGHAQDVWVVESSLGNYAVERCLVEVGRSIVLKAPSGHKATTFDYPVEFRSTNSMAVQDIDGLKLDHDLAAFMPQLASCGKLATEAVAAIMYIEPNGFPGSVGLAASVALDEAAADCAVQTIQRWKMSAVLPGRVLRANFKIPTYVASAEPAQPQRRAVSSASGRRRRR
jgi:TonB family protein